MTDVLIQCVQACGRLPSSSPVIYSWDEPNRAVKRRPSFPCQSVCNSRDRFSVAVFLQSWRCIFQCVQVQFLSRHIIICLSGNYPAVALLPCLDGMVMATRCDRSCFVFVTVRAQAMILVDPFCSSTPTEGLKAERKTQGC